MKVRRATPSDTGSISALYLQLCEHHARLAPENDRYQVGDEDWSRIAHEGVRNPNVRYYVAERGKEIIGFLHLYLVQKPWGLACEIETLVVKCDSRDKGVGTALMDRAEEVAREEGALAMRVNVLHTNEGGRRFYERSGYGVTAVRYAKRL